MFPSPVSCQGRLAIALSALNPLYFSVRADFHTGWVPIDVQGALPFLLQNDDLAELGSVISAGCRARAWVLSGPAWWGDS